MSKKSRAAIRSNLKQAIAPPTPPRKRSSHLDGLLDEYAPREETLAAETTHTLITAQPTQPAQGKQPDQGAQGHLSAPEQPAAPARDYMKVANSISRKAVPSGLFRGKSKQIYDFFYSQTRGAIMPRKECRLTRGAIMRGAHIGSTNTLRDNLLHLRAVGLLSWDDKSGEHNGNLYRVWIPEEIVNSMHHDQAVQADQAGLKLPSALRADSAQGDQGISITDATVSELPKTSFKTKDQITDDEAAAAHALSDHNQVFNEATRKLTGKSLSLNERDRWREFAELLVAELQIAAARTGQVSSVPAFLTEHLRRRLWKKDKAQLDREEKTAPEVQPKINASKCPDCGGAGWFYPEGQERGVAKCKHARLIGPNEREK
jgi:hypothetical protein